ncbi:unnamed protein product [Darwinula stevensoni]|uniref:Uncharacterized protein n=1 Tax=Darwinula stevensoni TaxID=69355 RepID=A0A7R9ACL6_9CRUS|nr:unnamed protein product [Darwinula stevensoni]CAG0900284.1 unnamed protein product [Darwinula stevensoni]
MDDADFAAWKRFHERREVWTFLTRGAWFIAFLAMTICFGVELTRTGFVLVAFLVLGPFTVLHIPFYVDSFDRRYREPRCRAAGVNPQLYMLPNVPYLLVEKGTVLNTGRTWHVETPEYATYCEPWAKRINCRVDRDALDVLRGKSWHLKTIVPNPFQGNPPFVLKLCSRTTLSSLDTAEIFLTDSSRFLQSYNNPTLMTDAPPPYPGADTDSSIVSSTEPSTSPCIGPSMGQVMPTISSSVQYQEESIRNPTFQFNLPITFQSELPPTYDEAVKVRPHN